MSNKEKRFICIVATEDKKPKAAYLSELDRKPYSQLILRPERAFSCSISQLVSLINQNEEIMRMSAVYFIEDKNGDNLKHLLDGEKEVIKLSRLISICVNMNHLIIRYKPEDMIPPIVTPSERQLADDALREIASQLHNQKTICNTKDTPIAMLPEGERDDDADYIYLLYTLTADNQLTYYRSENPRQTIRREKQLAEVFTKAEAQVKTMFADEDGCMWHVEKVNKVAAKESKEEQPEAKKRVGYVLYRLDSSGEKYYHFCKQSFNFEFKGKPVYIATNKIWADFKASALSSGDFGMPAWQVEEIEF